MRSVLVLLICGLVVGCQTTGGSSVALKPGMIVENHINASATLNTQIALPTGSWEVGAVSTRSLSSQTILMNIMLFQEKDGKVSKGIWIAVAIEKGNANGWTPLNYCSRENMHYIKTLSDENQGDQDCRWVNHYVPYWHDAKKQYQRDFAKYVSDKKLSLPNHVIQVGYRLADVYAMLHVQYYFNPETEGFEGSPRTKWINSPWNLTSVAQDPKKRAYIARIKAWVDDFYPKVKAGFDGKLTGLSRPKLAGSPKPSQGVSPSPSHKPSSVADRLKQLDALFKQELISKQEYEQRRKAILDSL